MTTTRSILVLGALITALGAAPALAQHENHGAAAAPAVEAPAGAPTGATATPSEPVVGDAAPAAPVDPSLAESASGRPWALSAGHSLAFGLQADEATSYWSGMLNLGGSYKLTKHLRVGVGTGIYWTLDPRPNDGRSLDGGALSASLRHGQLYKDETYTGLTVTGGVSIALPLMMRNFNARTYPWPTIGAQAGLSRSVGPVNLSYGLSLNKFNPAYAMYESAGCVDEREGTCIQGYEMSWQIGHDLSASWSPIEKLSLSGSFSFMFGRSFGPSVRDAQTSDPLLHDLPANARDGFGFSLSASYQLPVKGLAAGLSFSNGGPWYMNGTDLAGSAGWGIPILFDSRLAGMSIDVSYSY